MLPYLEFFGFSIPTYGAVSFIGVITSAFVSLLFARRRGVDVYTLACTGIAAAVGLFLGAHLLYGITNMNEIIYIFEHREYYRFPDFVKSVLECFGGMVFYGGLYGGLAAGYVFARIKKYPIGETGDVFALFIPLFHAFGRVGCFFAGCCFGVKSDLGFAGRVYAMGLRESVKRFPVQLLEAVCLVLLFIVMLLLFKAQNSRGRLMFIYLASYAVLRFALEFLRGDEIRGRLLMFSTSQWISIFTLVWVSLYLIVSHKRKQKMK